MKPFPEQKLFILPNQPDSSNLSCKTMSAHGTCSPAYAISEADLLCSASPLRMLGALMVWTKKHPVEPGVKSPVKEREGTCGASTPENRTIRTASRQAMLFCKNTILEDLFLVFHNVKRLSESCSSSVLLLCTIRILVQVQGVFKEQACKIRIGGKKKYTGGDEGAVARAVLIQVHTFWIPAFARMTGVVRGNDGGNTQKCVIPLISGDPEKFGQISSCCTGLSRNRCRRRDFRGDRWLSSRYATMTLQQISAA